MMNNYSISNAYLSISVKPLGAELTSLKTSDGHEHLWQGLPEYWTGQSPLLFPIVGGLPGNAYTLNGERYSMNSHGFARKSDWKMIHETENSLEFILESSPLTLEAYPFEFRTSVTYSLKGSGLHIEYLVENKNGFDMPFQIGAHPGFNCPLESCSDDGSPLEITDYELVFSRPETADRLRKNTILTGETVPFLRNENRIELSHSLFDQDALIFRDIVSEEILLRRKDGSGRKIRLKFPGFTHFGIWKKPMTDAPFICLEPWFGVDSTEGGPVELSQKEGMIILPPGNTFEAGYSVHIE